MPSETLSENRLHIVIRRLAYVTEAVDRPLYAGRLRAFPIIPLHAVRFAGNPIMHAAGW